MLALSIWQSSGWLGGLLIGLLGGFGARFFASASLGQDQRVLIDLLLAITSLGTIVLAWLSSIRLTSFEQDRGAGLLIASQPLNSFQQAIGRFLGLLAGSYLSYTLSILISLLIASWGQSLPITELALTWLVTAFELTVFVALANLLSSWTNSGLANLLTLGFWLVGNSIDLVVNASEGRLAWLTYVIPNFSRFNLHETYLSATTLPVNFYLMTGVYSLSWTIALVLLSSITLKKREW